MPAAVKADAGRKTLNANGSTAAPLDAERPPLDDLVIHLRPLVESAVEQVLMPS
jgi:hypothetical protein